MSKRFILVFASVSILAGCGVGDTYSAKPITQACGQDICVEVEIADTPETRQLWLMWRRALPQLSGMLFVFEEEQKYSFWMHNTLIPLDILWIDDELRIVDIQTVPPCEAQPCREYTPSSPALYVLEINAGAALEFGFETGTKLSLH